LAGSNLRQHGSELSTFVRSHLESQFRVHLTLPWDATMFLFEKVDVC
jgi:hypothetical protein